eukprot:271561-Alexandrium_andersonii.AAC.1
MEATLIVPPTRQGSTWRKHVPCPLCTKSTSALAGRRATASGAASLGLPTLLEHSAPPPFPARAKRLVELVRQVDSPALGPRR